MKYAVVLVAAIAGCATHSGVIPAGGNELVIFNEAATGFEGTAKLKALTLQQAGAHCGATGQTFETISEKEAKPPFIFGNYPRFELRFRCVK
jgi:hypothetical protein